MVIYIVVFHSSIAQTSVVADTSATNPRGRSPYGTGVPTAAWRLAATAAAAVLASCSSSPAEPITAPEYAKRIIPMSVLKSTPNFRACASIWSLDCACSALLSCLASTAEVT